MFFSRCISRMRYLNGSLLARTRSVSTGINFLETTREKSTLIPHIVRSNSVTCHTIQTSCIRRLTTSQILLARVRNEDSEPVLDPIEGLQKFVAVPILSEKERVFRPSQEEILKGQDLFIPKPDHKIKYLTSAVYDEHLPQHDLPEVAFIGRSNVGKSSLIKLLLAAADAECKIKCSKTPGHTKLLNFFTVGEKLALVDMPGYGFHMPKHYVDSVENFLYTRPNLQKIFLLIDGHVGLTGTDKQALEKLTETSAKLCLVLTKIDKAKPSALLKNVMLVKQHMKQLPHCTPQIFLVSSMTGDGLALLQTFIAYVTGNLAVNNIGVAEQ